MYTNRGPNFRPYGDVITVVRRDFPPADKTLVDPDNIGTNFIDGEWVTQDSNGKLIRPTNIATALDPAGTKLCWPIWVEPGRSDIMSQSEKKFPILWQGDWEFESMIFDPAAVVGSGAAITLMHQPLKIATITLGSVSGGSRKFSGLVGHGGSGDSAQAVGYVTRLPTANGGWLRMRGGNLY